MKIIEREVEFSAGSPPELYHAVGQQDYIAIVALTPDGRIPIVRQYRPALERFTWELPAGLVDKGEAAADSLPARTDGRDRLSRQGRACARQLRALHRAAVEPDPFILRRDRRARRRDRQTEAGIELKLVTPAELAGLILSGEFVLQLHIGAILLAGMRGHIDLGAFQAGPAKGSFAGQGLCEI